MGMFCFQCQEAAGGTGCTNRGVCGKTSDVANLQDLLIYLSRGLAFVSLEAEKLGIATKETDKLLMETPFATITNVNFDRKYFLTKINETLLLREKVKKEIIEKDSDSLNLTHDAVQWFSENEMEIEKKAALVGIEAEKNEDIRSLKELITYAIKGIAAYAFHASALGFEKNEVFLFMKKALAAGIDENQTVDSLISLALETGKAGVEVMELLDKANTSTYGHPEITNVDIGVRSNPGILISGHDLKDLAQLLEQTEGTGIDVYTHGEMLPAQYYPFFKKYSHFAGNYGNAWWKQNEEFEQFRGPILMTTNCLIPPKESYIERLYTTGPVGFQAVKHISENENGEKDFSEIIHQAKECFAPLEIEKGSIIGGFAHNTVLGLADKVIDAVKAGAIKRFVVMAGCDGRMKSRKYYQDFAASLPQDTVILTAGCAKYKYNKLDLGDIGGIPRILDAGQCNDCYSLVVIALKLKEAFNLEDINDLPITYNISWYEQKAVTVLLALLYLGVNNIHLGPTLPAFLSPNVAKVLVDNFGIGGITTVEEDLKIML